MFVIRIGSPLQHHYFTGGYAYNRPLWSRDPAQACRFPDHHAANETARAMMRWISCPHRDVVQVNA